VTGSSFEDKAIMLLLAPSFGFAAALEAGRPRRSSYPCTADAMSRDPALRFLYCRNNYIFDWRKQEGVVVLILRVDGWADQMAIEVQENVAYLDIQSLHMKDLALFAVGQNAAS
jgi:hypothetical protein